MSHVGIQGHGRGVAFVLPFGISWYVSLRWCCANKWPKWPGKEWVNPFAFWTPIYHQMMGHVDPQKIYLFQTNGTKITISCHLSPLFVCQIFLLQSSHDKFYPHALSTRSKTHRRWIWLKVSATDLERTLHTNCHCHLLFDMDSHQQKNDCSTRYSPPDWSTDSETIYTPEN